MSSPRTVDRKQRPLSILPACVRSSLRKTENCRHSPFDGLHWEKQRENCGYSPFGCLCTVFTERNREAAAATLFLSLAVCIQSSLTKQKRNNGYSPFGCLCTVLMKNSLHETTFTLHFALCVVSLRPGDILVGIIFIISVSWIMCRALTYQKNCISSACIL